MKNPGERIYKSCIDLYNQKNNLYAGYPYDLHIIGCQAVFTEFAELLSPVDQEAVLVAVWMHDLMEDCAVTYNDIIKLICSPKEFLEPSDTTQGFPKKVADIVYAVTNELGKNRKERNEKTYPKISGNELATFVKLCDRIANTRFSKYSGSPMFGVYQKEYHDFKEALRVQNSLAPMWECLSDLYSQ